MRRRPNVGLLFVHRLRRWPNNGPMYRVFWEPMSFEAKVTSNVQKDVDSLSIEHQSAQDSYIQSYLNRPWATRKPPSAPPPLGIFHGGYF